MYKVFIDGREGTTGLRIDAMLENRTDIALLSINPAKRKDAQARKNCMNSADLVFLCLPDAAAKEAAALAENPKTKIIDASTAHRTNPAWAYGFPELSAAHRKAVQESRLVSNPGCHATGFISLVYPLVKLGILGTDAQIACHSVTGYTGGGKSMISQYEDPYRDQALDSPRQYGLNLNHKHVPEMKAVCGLQKAPIFCPVVADFPRGMVTTVPLFFDLLKKKHTVSSLRRAFEDYYGGGRFIRVMPEGDPGFLAANGWADTNELQIFVTGDSEKALVMARFDNLGKGASGAAVQNMNLMLGLDEAAGLT